MDFFLKWLASFGLGKVTNRLETLVESGLFGRLESVIEKWSKGLPEHAGLDSPQALLPHPNVQSLEDPPPEPKQILDRIENDESPTTADWHAALFAQWRWVVGKISDPQDFFRLPDDESSQFLQELAEDLERECMKDEGIFRVESLRAGQRFESQLRELQATVDESQQGKIESAKDIAEIKMMLSQFVESQETNRDDKSSYDKQIDDIVRFMKEGKPDVSITLFTEFRENNWPQLSKKERFRVAANLGHAYVAVLEYETAAAFFREASSNQEDPEQAACFDAYSYFVAGDKSQAFAAAETIRADYPDSDFANAIWIRSAHKSERYCDIEAAIPIDAQQKPETRFALAFRALGDSEYTRAEQFARDAAAEDDESHVLKELLAQILIESVRSEVRSQYASQPSISNPQRLYEAIALVNAALELAPEAGKAQLRFLRGHANELLGNDVEAEADIRAAYDADSTNSDHGRHFALLLWDRDLRDEAIEVLDRCADNDESGRCTVLRAVFLSVRRKHGDFDKAIDLLQEQATKLGDFDQSLRVEILANLVEFLCDRKRFLEAFDAIAEVDEGLIPDAAIGVVKAVGLRLSEKIEAAKSEVRAARDLLTDATDDRVFRRVAVELSVLGLFEEALPIWKQLVQPHFFGLDTLSLIRCAVNCEDDEFVIRFCSELRQNGHINREALHLELDLLQKYNCTERELIALNELLQKSIDESLQREIRLRRSLLGIATNQPELVESSPDCLPTVADVEPHMGFFTVQVLRQSENPMAAVEYAYELLRRDFSSSWAHKSIITAFLLGNRNDLKLPEPTAVEAGSAVKYRERNGGEAKWVIIEEGGSVDISREEIEPDSSLAKELLGKTVGDEFAIRSGTFSDRNGKILEIWSKYKYRFNESMEQWEERFHDEFFLWKLELKKDANGDLDFTPIFKSIDARDEQIKKLEDVYRSNPLSVTYFALMNRVTVLESLQHLCSADDLPVRCTVGGDKDFHDAHKALNAGNAIVLCESALATLFISDAYDYVGKLPFTKVVTSGVFQQFRELYLRNLYSPREGGYFSKRDDQYVLNETTPAETEAFLGRLKSFVDWIEKHCEIQDGLSLASLEKEARNELVDGLGRPAAESIAFAEANAAAIWTDDICIAQLANSRQVIRTWTDVTFDWGMQNQHIAKEEHAKLVVQLIRHGFFYTRLTEDALYHAGNTANWDRENNDLATVFSWFSNRFTKPAGIVEYAAKMFIDIPRRTDSTFRGDQLLTDMLNQISSRPDGERLIDAIPRKVGRLSPIDIYAARNAGIQIAQWRSGKLIVVQ